MKKKIIRIIQSILEMLSNEGTVLAKDVFIPPGTAVVVYTENEIDADDVRAGQNLDFIVQESVIIDDITVIPSGTHVNAQVTKRKNNFILGIAGELQVGNFKIKAASDNMINLRGVIIDKGTNRAWCNIGWFFLFPLIFIKGNDGKIPAGTYQIVYTIGSNEIRVKD